MPPVPPELRRLFDAWIIEGRPAQRAFPWKTAGWHRWVPGHSDVLAELPNPIGRADVAALCSEIQDEESAARAFLAASVWGFGDAGYGPYRTRAIFDNNPGFPADLVSFAKISQTQGGLAAFEHVVQERRANRSYFKGYGPAFATKFIYFTTKAVSDVETSPVMDKVVATWFRKHYPEVRLRLGWHSAGSYRQYLEALNGWADELGIEVEDVEQLIFTPGRS
ncbi:hypothetical protein M1D93_13190 [Arthrobacter sp. Z1-9]